MFCSACCVLYSKLNVLQAVCCFACCVVLLYALHYTVLAVQCKHFLQFILLLLCLQVHCVLCYMRVCAVLCAAIALFCAACVSVLAAAK